MKVSVSFLSEVLNPVDIIKKINADGVTVLLVEQNANKALSIANRAYVLETGAITVSGDADDVANNPKVKEAYLG